MMLGQSLELRSRAKSTCADLACDPSLDAPGGALHFESQVIESLEYDDLPAQRGKQASHSRAIADEESRVCYSAEWCRVDHNRSLAGFNYKINME